MKNKQLTLLGLLLVLFAVACDSNYFGRVLTRNSSIEPDVVNENQIPVPPGGDENKDYFAVETTFPPATENGVVFPEILFVMDTSGSMADEKNALITALEGWLNQLQSLGVENFCVDVMEAASNSINAGRLRAASGNDRCLCTDTLTIPQIVTKFSQNINSISFQGGAGEAGIYSLHQALTDSGKLAANQADGCFRSDLTLAVIEVSDEQDHGATVVDPSSMNCTGNVTRSDGSTVDFSTVDWDNSTFPTLDGSFVTSPASASKYVSNTCDEAQIRLRYYSEATPTGPGGSYKLTVTPESVANELAEYNDALPSFGTGLIYNTTTFPTLSGAESKGWGFFEFAAAFNQTTANLATTNNQANFNAQLNVIADALATALTYRYKYDLPDPVCAGEEDSVVVKINGTTISESKWSLNSLRTWVKFKPNFNWPAYGASPVVSIDYTRCE